MKNSIWIPGNTTEMSQSKSTKPKHLLYMWCAYVQATVLGIQVHTSTGCLIKWLVSVNTAPWLASCCLFKRIQSRTSLNYWCLSMVSNQSATLTSDPWHHQGFSLHTRATHWLFSLFRDILCEPQRRLLSENTSLPPNNLVSFHFDAVFELQKVCLHYVKMQSVAAMWLAD